METPKRGEAKPPRAKNVEEAEPMEEQSKAKADSTYVDPFMPFIPSTYGTIHT